MIQEINNKLFEMQDLKYRDFHAGLMPTIDKSLIIGVRTPMLRSFAKELIRTAKKDAATKEFVSEFLTQLPHKYYEENNLHGFLLESIKDFDTCVKMLERFLPYINNWATCDSIAPSVFKKEPIKLLPYIDKWLEADEVYTIRYAIGALMKYFLNDLFEVKYLEKVAGVVSEEYYVNMMIAWYFATALAKQYDEAVKFIENQRLEKWTHNKAIQKAVESNRITKEQKAYLKTLKI